MRQFANVLSDLAKFAKKTYRDGFMQTQVRGGIAYQIHALRQKFGLTQAEFAEKTGKKQSVISRLESTEYGKASVQTLLDIASANDVALVVRFVSYPEFLAQTADMSPEALQPDTVFESIEKQSQTILSPGLTAPASIFAWMQQPAQESTQDWSRVLSGRSEFQKTGLQTGTGSVAQLHPYQPESLH